MGKLGISRPFDYITTRALKYDVILSRGRSLLTYDGKIIIYSASPLNQSGIGEDWSLVAERGFDLPMGFGHRVISILGRALK
jgi:hypothetical protein